MGTDFYNNKILPYAGIIIKICRAYTNSQSDFEDYYQEVCLQIWRSRTKFNNKCAWTTWIYKISINVCLTYLKKDKSSLLEFTSDQLPENEMEDCRHESEHTVRNLYAAIQQLSEIDRALILLYLEQQTNQDIADILGITSNNVAVRVLRIKQKLNSLLNAGIQ